MILLTAFQKFNGDSLNSSEEVFKHIQGVEKLLLPVTFAESWMVLRERLETAPPKVLLMLGQAKGREKINLEKVGLNLIDSEIKDENGHWLKDLMIDKDGEAALLTNVDLHLTKDLLASHPVKISYSAGAFVCNFIYYQALIWGLTRGIKVLFVHLPILPEQNSETVSHPYLELSDQLNCVQDLIQLFKSAKI